MYHRTYQILFFFLFIFFFYTGQAQEVESVRDSIKKYIYNDHQKATYYTTANLKTAIKEENVDAIIRSYGTLAVIYEVKGDIDSIFYFLNKGIHTSKVHEKKKDLIFFTLDKGRIYEEVGAFDKALALFSEALALSKESSLLKLANKIEDYFETLKSKIRHPKEAATLFKERYLVEKKKGKSFELRMARKDLMENYLQNSYPDSVLLLASEGLKEADIRGDGEFKYKYTLLQAKSFLQKESIEEAYTSAEKALTYATQIANPKSINEASYILSKIYTRKGQAQKAIETLNTILKTQIIKTPIERTKYYQLLAENYKSVDSIDRFYEYYERFNLEKEKLSVHHIETLENIHNINLKGVEEQVTAEKRAKYYWIIAFLIAAFIAIYFFIRHYKQNRKNQKRFEELLKQIETFEKNQTPKVSNTIRSYQVLQPQSKDVKPYTIKDEKVTEILEKLKKLEEKEYYLRQDCTLHNMAKKLKTNTAYLSKIINTELNKSFNTYINELRVNYAIISIKNNSKLRSYSVRGIAEELGYKNADAFSRFFKATTGLSPSVYIKKINQLP